MLSPLALYRRLEGGFVRSGRIILQHDEDYFDLTETLWRAEDPMLLSALSARGFFDDERFEAWMEDAVPPRTEPIHPDDVLLAPLLPMEVGKIVALGKNFRAHAEEFSEEVPETATFFNKLPETLRGHNQTISPPPGYGGRFDHEVELAVIIGRRAHRIEASKALDYVAGYSVANDLTLRTWQAEDRKKGQPWFRAKNFEHGCPLGPCFVPEATLDTAGLRIRSWVNGELRQDATTADLVVSIPEALADISQRLTLNPGDILLMGTPAGVGPLENGDEVVCEIEGIGRLRNVVKR